MTRTRLGNTEIWKPESHDGRFIVTDSKPLSIGQVVMRGEQAFLIVQELTHAEAIKMVSGEPELAMALFEPFLYEGVTD